MIHFRLHWCPGSQKAERSRRTRRTEDCLRIHLVGAKSAEKSGRGLAAPEHSLLKVYAQPGFANPRRGKRQRFDDVLERNGIGFLVNRTEGGDHAEQWRYDGQSKPPEAFSSGARYNPLLVVVVHVAVAGKV